MALKQSAIETAPASGVPTLRSASGLARPTRGRNCAVSPAAVVAIRAATCHAAASVEPFATAPAKASPNGESASSIVLSPRLALPSFAIAAYACPTAATRSDEVVAPWSPSSRPAASRAAPHNAPDVPPAAPTMPPRPLVTPCQGPRTPPLRGPPPPLRRPSREPSPGRDHHRLRPRRSPQAVPDSAVIVEAIFRSADTATLAVAREAASEAGHDDARSPAPAITGESMARDSPPASATAPFRYAGVFAGAHQKRSSSSSSQLTVSEQPAMSRLVISSPTSGSTTLSPQSRSRRLTVRQTTNNSSYFVRQVRSR